MTKRQTPRTQQPPVPETSEPPYRAPQQLLDRCPGCGCIVLRGLALPGGKIKRVDPVQFPVTGRDHDCDEALALELAVQGLRWNTVRIVARQCLPTT